MRWFGASLILAAFVLHFTFCFWNPTANGTSSAIFAFVCDNHDIASRPVCIVAGLVAPILLLGMGIGLVRSKA